DQLNGTIDSLSSISSENANSAEITSGACDDISRIIDSVSDKAGIIKAHSDELGNAVGKYKV
ncbi:MAG: hypothetical protein K6G43_11645, partial [Lachnospiraceae bacterium]|nr:hypothetical protein [Lachnospiraceae bacterium]